MRRLLLLPVFLLAACGDGRLPQIDLVGEALGTTFKVSVVEPAASLDTAALETDILAALARVDALASTWRDDTELAALNAADTTDWVEVSDKFCAALADSWAVSRASGGAFDATIGPLVNLWGFGPDGRVVVPPDEAAVADARQHVGYDKLELDCDNARVRKSDAQLYVDLSGWAKGYAVQQPTQGAPGSLVTVKTSSGWLRDAQRFPVIIRFDDDSARGYRFIGGQADVQIYTQKSNALLNGLGSAWIRLMSWLSYVY